MESEWADTSELAAFISSLPPFHLHSSLLTFTSVLPFQLALPYSLPSFSLSLPPLQPAFVGELGGASPPSQTDTVHALLRRGGEKGKVTDGRWKKGNDGEGRGRKVQSGKQESEGK